MNLSKELEIELETTSLQIFVNDQEHLNKILDRLAFLGICENAKEFKQYKFKDYGIKSLVLKKFNKKNLARVYYSSNENPNKAYKLITEGYLGMFEKKYNKKKLII